MMMMMMMIMVVVVVVVVIMMMMVVMVIIMMMMMMMRGPGSAITRKHVSGLQDDKVNRLAGVFPSSAATVNSEVFFLTDVFISDISDARSTPMLPAKCCVKAKLLNIGSLVKVPR